MVTTRFPYTESYNRSTYISKFIGHTKCLVLHITKGTPGEKFHADLVELSMCSTCKFHNVTFEL